MEAKRKIPLWGVRRFARQVLDDLAAVSKDRDEIHATLSRIGGISQLEREREIERLNVEIACASATWKDQLAALTAKRDELLLQLDELQKQVVETRERALLQESGVYEYAHPLQDAVAYKDRLGQIRELIKELNKADGHAVVAAIGWTVNGSEAQGRTMLRDYCKLMLRAFNAEADVLVRGLKPYALPAAIERIEKVAKTIQRLGKTMSIRITDEYLQLRIAELQLTADFVQKKAEEKEVERQERERLREERKIQQEMERERLKLEKERQHYVNALAALVAKGDSEAAERMRNQVSEVERAIADVDYRVANIRAGYVYVISNIGSFGESLIKVGMTRRLDPMDRIRELSDASVPFNFDVHALFFSKDAVGIEAAMHAKLAKNRANLVNHRREFFRATPLDARDMLADLAGDLLTFHDIPDALEFRQSQKLLNGAIPT
ncbi:DUF4041 domain-containing protein [Xanthomonas sp. NCPPB 2654]|uniref:DUF4041 domain-containing protein n=1 Tax=unclassified Xanthomonas TaxID=2643310 RepID=UPI0021DFDD8C|nr:MULTISPECIES: DUF4041 domain-containing protein [unclassified Xanthomonas]MDL5366567.1 DUF4041 domain-containing protein [Xanthomonas sp. NCPPB 2654]UYC21293.1 DUF4041 domain-containing protein [Xanthomonas sp. CFBP 8443]